MSTKFADFIFRAEVLRKWVRRYRMNKKSRKDPDLKKGEYMYFDTCTHKVFTIRIKSKPVRSRNCTVNSSWTPYYPYQGGKVSWTKRDYCGN